MRVTMTKEPDQRPDASSLMQMKVFRGIDFNSLNDMEAPVIDNIFEIQGLY